MQKNEVEAVAESGAIKAMTLRIPIDIADWVEKHAKARGMSQQAAIMMAIGRLRVAVDRGEA